MQLRFQSFVLLLCAACARGGAEQQPVNPVDLMISDHVRQAILEDKSIGSDAGSIRVGTQAGRVTLSGFVRTDAVKQRVGIVVKAVGSVAQVENQLVVDPQAAQEQQPLETVVDRTISDRVRLAFSGDRTLAAEASALSVLTQDGVVRLSGRVSSEVVRARMTVVANAVGSVKRVENRLVLKQP